MSRSSAETLSGFAKRITAPVLQESELGDLDKMVERTDAVRRTAKEVEDIDNEIDSLIAAKQKKKQKLEEMRAKEARDIKAKAVDTLEALVVGADPHSNALKTLITAGELAGLVKTCSVCFNRFLCGSALDSRGSLVDTTGVLTSLESRTKGANNSQSTVLETICGSVVPQMCAAHPLCAICMLANTSIGGEESGSTRVQNACVMHCCPGCRVTRATEVFRAVRISQRDIDEGRTIIYTHSEVFQTLSRGPPPPLREREREPAAPAQPSASASGQNVIVHIVTPEPDDSAEFSPHSQYPEFSLEESSPREEQFYSPSSPNYSPSSPDYSAAMTPPYPQSP